jgi:molecular chaperone DnaK (HSP70)
MSRKATRVLIPRFSTLPARGESTLTTFVDYQPGMLVKVREGEHPLAKDNELLAEFELQGIQRAPKTVPKIRVVFMLDENGILSVTATDQYTGASDSLKVSNVFGFADTDAVTLAGFVQKTQMLMAPPARDSLDLEL